jgi:hypothetical protein
LPCFVRVVVGAAFIVLLHPFTMGRMLARWVNPQQVQVTVSAALILYAIFCEAPDATLCGFTGLSTATKNRRRYAQSRTLTNSGVTLVRRWESRRLVALALERHHFRRRRGGEPLRPQR